MFDNISEQIINKLIENQTIQAEDKEIYQFGVKQIFTIALNIVTVLALGVSLHMLMEAVLFMVAFIPLRIYAGGSSCENTTQMLHILNFFLAAVLLAMRFTEIPNLVYCVLYVISSIIVLFLSPVEDKNKPLDEMEISVYKKRAIMLWIIESVIIFICFLCKFRIVAECFVISLSSVAMMLILGALKNKVTKNG